MGRVKLQIKKIENPGNLQVTYSKRRNGLIKKAYELSVLCDIDIALVMFSPTGKVSQFCTANSTIEDVIARFAKTPQHERTKRGFETLQVLYKAIQKLSGEARVDVQHSRLDVQAQMENELLKSKLQELTAENELLKQKEKSLQSWIFNSFHASQQEFNPVMIPEPKEFVENNAEFSTFREQNPSFPSQTAWHTYPAAGASADAIGGQLAEVNTWFDPDQSQGMSLNCRRDSWTGSCAQPGTSTGVCTQPGMLAGLCDESIASYAQPGTSTDLCAQPGTSTGIYAQPATSTGFYTY